MRVPTEIRIFIERPHDIYDDIINRKVVNIYNNLTKKEEKIMLENEKNFELEQLNLLKVKYETNLDVLKNTNLDTEIEEKIAKIREEIATEIITVHENAIKKAEFLVEAINEKIAEVEAIEVEIPTTEIPASIENVQNEIPAENAEF